MNSPTWDSREEKLSGEPSSNPQSGSTLEALSSPLSRAPYVPRGPLSPAAGWRWIWKSLPAARRGMTARQNTPPQSKSTSFAMARPRRMKQTARALLLWVPIWYVIAQLALLVWMNDRWQPLQYHVEARKWKQLHRRIAESPERPLVLMIGSSRTDWGFQAGRLTGQRGPDGRPLLAYNLGVPTTGPLHEALYLNDLLEEGIRPRLLLVEFPTTHLNRAGRGILSEETFILGSWSSVHQVHFFSPYLTNAHRAKASWLEGRLAPCYAFRWDLHQHLLGKHSETDPLDQARRPMDKWGSRLLVEDPGTPEYRAYRKDRAQAMYFASLQRFRLGAGPRQALRDLLQRCRRERLPVAVVVMPETPDFRKLYRPGAEEEIQQVLADLRADFGVEVIDATAWLGEEDFDDGHHLIKAGAAKFTARLITEVKELLERTQPAS